MTEIDVDYHLKIADDLIKEAIKQLKIVVYQSGRLSTQGYRMCIHDLNYISRKISEESECDE